MPSIKYRKFTGSPSCLEEIHLQMVDFIVKHTIDDGSNNFVQRMHLHVVAINIRIHIYNIYIYHINTINQERNPGVSLFVKC